MDFGSKAGAVIEGPDLRFTLKTGIGPEAALISAQDPMRISVVALDANGRQRFL